jgi:DNA-binding beta-propeller fold protein YncE
MRQFLPNRVCNLALAIRLSVELLPFFLGMCSTCLAQSVAVDVATTGNVIAVNPVTNKIYTGNQTLPYVTVIDGATHELTIDRDRGNTWVNRCKPSDEQNLRGVPCNSRW